MIHAPQTLSSGDADFSVLVSVGGSFTSGFQSSGLQERHQKRANPALFAVQVQKEVRANGVTEAKTTDFVIPGLKEKGEILTLDYDQATSVGLAAYVSPSLEALLEREGLGSAEIIRQVFGIRDIKEARALRDMAQDGFTPDIPDALFRKMFEDRARDLISRRANSAAHCRPTSLGSALSLYITQVA